MNQLLKVSSLLATLAPFCASAVEVVELAEPIKSTVQANSVVCTTPETLFLLYESTRFVKNAEPQGGKQSSAFFDSIFTHAKESGACALQPGTLDVSVDSVIFMQNAWNTPDSTMAYGSFKHPAMGETLYAPLMALPGLRDAMQRLTTQAVPDEQASKAKSD